MREPGRNPLLHSVLFLCGGLLLVHFACGPKRAPQTVSKGYKEKGVASWYGPGFDGKRTANGEVYDMDKMTAAHKTLPFDAVVEIKNLDNGRSTRVRINDRGPFVKGRVIDLSRAAAKKIDMLGPGTARVSLRVVDAPRRANPAGSYWVQVGAFRDKDNATELARRLRGDYGDVRIRSADGLHRVGFGPYSKRGAAEERARKLGGDGVEAFVVSGS